MSRVASVQCKDWNRSAAGESPSPVSECQPSLCWFLVFTKPGGEKTARINLERQGFRVYCPQLLRPVFRKGRWVERIVSLFPRYMFIQLDAARQSLASVRSTLGVASVVRFGSQPTVVPNAIVETLMANADPESGLHKLSRLLEPGSRVSVIAGPFDGVEGVFDHEIGAERVVILLRVLGREATVKVPSQYVVPAALRR